MDERKREIANALDGIVQPGDSWHVRGISNEILVEPQMAGPQSNGEAELEARMLQLNDQLSSAGINIMIGGMLMILAACLGLYMKWFDALIGPFAAKLQSVWVYLFAIVCGFILLTGFASILEKMHYRRNRQSFLIAIRNAGLSPPVLLTKIKDDENYSNLVGQMKSDPDVFSF